MEIHASVMMMRSIIRKKNYAIEKPVLVNVFIYFDLSIKEKARCFQALSYITDNQTRQMHRGQFYQITCQFLHHSFNVMV